LVTPLGPSSTLAPWHKDFCLFRKTLCLKLKMCQRKSFFKNHFLFCIKYLVLRILREGFTLPLDAKYFNGLRCCDVSNLGFYYHYKYLTSFVVFGAILSSYFLKVPTNCFKGIMSISSSVSISNEFTGFSSVGGESTRRVIRVDRDADSISSSATLSCMKDSNEATTAVVANRAKRIVPKINFCPGYNWVNPKVREFFSRYRSSKDLRDFLSNTHIYSSNIIEDIISFRRAGNVDKVCHGRENGQQ